ncbi:hypothetical protein ACWD1Y_40830, partial [Streptomyces sp. NPDC002814]
PAARSRSVPAPADQGPQARRPTSRASTFEGYPLHHRDSITRLPDTPSVRVTRQVCDQYARPLEITDLVVDAHQDALVYEFTLPAAG